MGDESSLSRQIESVERSMVFLRQEHLTLLHGLHLEILSLQKRCSELTTDLKVQPPGRSQIELQEEEELLQARCLDMENRLAEQDCTLGELRKELSHKGALVGALRANLKEKERHFLEELKRRSHCSTILNTELQKQTEAAAYLSFQLHAARQKLHHQRMQQRQGLLARANNQGPHYGAELNSVPPQMSSGACPSSPVVKPKRKSTGASLRVERARECVPVERVMGPAEPTAMPDPALFLHPRRHRARSRHTVADRQAPLGMEKEAKEEGGGEGPVEPQDEAARLVSSATMPPAAETKAD
ncbi:coiled-coil domain-containing protein 92 [Echeneis naucrates]|uniref:Coiled-coil domain-containing protein 92-like n=1 Tax=Echeneis naucrates TaxID=173247 RepID=A0A665T338_ECHNA|nr:coiled-coil domain-containing protein 92-like [Echeneis naucrates]XP_029373734.1 coiled-coil domain-containing protein 92-like [Echeneis naucrates]